MKENTHIRKNVILGHIFQYASAEYFSQFLGFFTSILLRKFLGPLSFGIWNMLKLILDYSGYANLGTTSTVTYKVPLLRGQGRSPEADRLSQVVFNFLSFAAFICSILVVLYAFIFGRNLPREIFFGLLAVSVLLLSQRVFTYYLVLLRANKDFGVLGRSIIFDAVINILFTLTIVQMFGLYGFYVVIVIMPILNVIFIRRHVTYGLRLTFDLKDIFSHIRYGLPLLVSSILEQILNSIDRIMIVSMLGLEQLGFYSIALMAKSYGTGVSKNFSIVVQPHFLEDFDPDNHARSFKHAEIYAQVNAFFMCILLSLVFIFIGPLVQYVLPRFVPGITATRIYLLAILFLTITPYLTNILVAIGRQKVLMFISGTAICINVSLNFFLIRRGYGINGAAVATVFSSFFAFLSSGVLSYYGKQDLKGFFILLLKVFLPVLYCAFLLFCVSMIEVRAGMFVESISQGVVFLLLSVPLILVFEKKFGIIKTVFKSIFSSKKANGSGE